MKNVSTVFTRLACFSRAALLTFLAIAAVTVSSIRAEAAVVCSNLPAALDIPNTFDGLYINFVTGTSGTTSGAVPGWDSNIWSSSGSMKFFASTSAANASAVVGSAGEASLLAPGTMIDSSSAVLTGVLNAAAFEVGVTNGYVGFAFNNEGTSTTNYGWASLTTTSGGGFPATLNQYCYDDSGAGIMAGTTPVSLQSYSID
ncbi:MAG TPA: hypothetical protein VFN25_01885 [Dokdonella sp.]|uniref:hypothetical protein n=1 Tax=Dokdonella sp. TaxID=2291710 RepID=UPI002D7EB812|nr:hypothetical protein [Dokdonella sp.]HET9031634.1 hypothetical protein [Dokdonella sp.]